MTREMNSKTEQSVTPEQQKKLLDKVDKCRQDVQKVPVGGDVGRGDSELRQTVPYLWGDGRGPEGGSWETPP